MNADPDGATLSKVTIAIPTYNRRAYLDAAIRSSLAQTHPRLEIVVSDNASTDGTAGLLAAITDPRVVVLRQPTNLGMMGNWDACLARATGCYFLLLSDDDLLEPRAIAEMVAKFEAPDGERVGVVYARADIIGPHGEVLHRGLAAPASETAAEAIRGFFDSRRPTFPCTILLRTDDLRAEGGYSYEGLTLACDARAWMAVAMRRGEVRFLPEVLARYRVHPGGLTVQSALETWLNNNRSLAVFCARIHRNCGDEAAAAELLIGVQRMNARVTTSLLQQIGDLEGRPVRRIARFLSMRRYFRSPRCLPTVLASMARLVTPPLIFSTLRRIKGLRHSLQ